MAVHPSLKAPPATATSAANENADQCYRLRDHPGYTPMLDLQTVEGERWLFPYAMLLWACWDRAGKIVVRFTTHTVAISGRGLQAIHDGLMAHRLEFVQAEFGDLDDGAEGDAFVSEIAVVSDKEARQAPSDPDDGP